MSDAPRLLPTRRDDTVLGVLRNPRLLTREALAGIVTTLALVPEVISFSVIAGVDPMVSLVASIVLALVMSVLGGRPAMVTAAAGSVALVIAPLVKEHGVEYVLPTVVLAGLVQLAFGLAGLARLMRFIPRSVMIGFVNALGVLIFVAQVPHVIDQPWVVYPLFALTLGIVLLLPRLTTAVPAPLVAIVVVTAIVVVARLDVTVVGDEGRIGGGLPGLTPWLAPFDLTTLSLIWPTALSVAFVGLMETLLTAKLVDDLTDTPSHKGKESWALGVANIAAGFYGGIAGCAMIGQTVVNVRIGRARTRVSTIVAGLFLLLLVTALSEVMARIPMVALAAVMMVVAVTTVDWHSLRPATLRSMPVPETLVMVVTVAVVVATNNLAVGVGVGVVLAMVLFARRVAHVISVERVVGAGAGAGGGAGAGAGGLGVAPGADADGVSSRAPTFRTAGPANAVLGTDRGTPTGPPLQTAGGAAGVEGAAGTDRGTLSGPPLQTAGGAAGVAGAAGVEDAARASSSVRYVVSGPLFFGSSNDLVEQFAYADDPAHVVVDLSGAQVWDASSVAALDSVETKYREHGRSVAFEGLDERSTAFHGRLTGRLGS